MDLISYAQAGDLPEIIYDEHIMRFKWQAVWHDHLKRIAQNGNYLLRCLFLERKEMFLYTRNLYCDYWVWKLGQAGRPLKGRATEYDDLIWAAGLCYADPALNAPPKMIQKIVEALIRLKWKPNAGMVTCWLTYRTRAEIQMAEFGGTPLAELARRPLIWLKKVNFAEFMCSKTFEGIEDYNETLNIIWASQQKHCEKVARYFTGPSRRANTATRSPEQRAAQP